MSSDPKVPARTPRLTPPRSFSPLRISTNRPAARAESVVLVVDGDRVSRHFVDFALTRAAPSERAGAIAVETAQDAAGALAILRTTIVDLILSDSDLPDMSGLQFQRQLTHDSRFSAVPFVFFSANGRVKAKVLAIAAGAEDYLVKPCDPTELSTRVQAIIDRRRRMRDASRSRDYALAGDFAAIPFPDLVGILGMGQCNGTLAVATPRAVGRVFFQGGRVVHAVLGNLVGPEAFYEILGEPNGKFELSLGTDGSEAGVVTINDTLTALIMEGARVLDSRRAESPPPLSKPRTATLPPAALPAGPELQPPLDRSPHLAAQLVQGLSDPFALGELCLFAREDLERWTSASGGRERLHVLLLANLKAGVSALMPLASEPTERWVLDALRPEPKTIGLAFFLRKERIVDVILLDVRSAGSLSGVLHRAPALVILAPPEGDFLEIGTRALVELEGLLTRLSPTMVLGIGDVAFEREFRRWSSTHGYAGQVECLRGALGEGRTDLRATLVEGIRLWGAGTEEPRSSRA